MLLTTSKAYPQTRPPQPVIFRPGGKHRAGVGKYAHVPDETELQPSPSLAEPLADIIELITTTAKDVRCQTCFEYGKAEDQVSGSAADKTVRGPLRISFAIDAKIAAEKIVHSDTCAQSPVTPDPVSGKMVDRSRADRARGEGIKRKLLGMI